MDYEPPRGSFSRKWKKNKIDKIPDDHFWDTFFSPPTIHFREIKKIILFFCHFDLSEILFPRTWFESEFQNKSTKKCFFYFIFPSPHVFWVKRFFFIPAPHGFWVWRKNTIIFVWITIPHVGYFPESGEKNKIDKLTFISSPDHTFQRNKKIIIFFCFFDFFYSPRTWFESEFQNESTKNMIF